MYTVGNIIAVNWNLSLIISFVYSSDFTGAYEKQIKYDHHLIVLNILYYYDSKIIQ